MELAKPAKQVGVELLVLDDGWLGVEMMIPHPWVTGNMMPRSCHEAFLA